MKGLKGLKGLKNTNLTNLTDFVYNYPYNSVFINYPFNPYNPCSEKNNLFAGISCSPRKIVADMLSAIGKDPTINYLTK